MAGPEDRERDAGEDLFGDLDDFFAPIEDVDWPEEGEAAEGTDAPPAGEGEATGSGEEGWDPAVEEPAEPVEESAEPEQPAAEEPLAEEPAGPVEESAEPEQPAAEEPLAEEPAGPVEESAEPEQPAAEEPDDVDALFGEDDEEGGWDRLRSDLGGADPAPADPTAAAAEGAAAPPEPAGAEDPFVVGDVPPAGDVPEPEPEAPAAPPAEAGGSEEVEAAAAHFASGLDAEEVERDILSDLGGPDAAEGPVVIEPEDEEPILGGEGGPAWQEPAAYEVGEEGEDVDLPPPPAGTKNLPAAIASGAILGIALLAILSVGKGPFVVLAIALVLLAQGEFYAAVKRRGFQPATGLGLVCGGLLLAGAYVRGGSGQGESAAALGLALGAMLSVLWFMAAPPRARKGLVANVGVTVLGIVYVPFLISFAFLLLAAPGSLGRDLLLTVLALTVLYDVCAYAIGTLWGNRPLAPSVSPKKSWEGAIGATVVIVLVSLAVVPALDAFEPARALGLAFVISIAGPLGDLAESAIKRDLRIKDMGSILPGHGGLLDRMDAILFTAPFAYYYLRIVM